MAVRRLPAARALVMLLVAAASAGCALLVDSSGLAGGSPADGAAPETLVPLDGGDAGDGDGDAGEGDAATEAATDAGPRKNSCGALLFGTPMPLSNGDFEIGCANGWGAYQATVTEDTTTPSQGAIACRLCYTSGDYGFSMQATLAQPILAGENYEVVACIRALPGGPEGLPVHAEIAYGSEGAAGTPTNAGPTYAPVRVAWTVPRALPAINLDVRATGPAGSCFLVDDVSLSRVRDAAID